MDVVTRPNASLRAKISFGLLLIGIFHFIYSLTYPPRYLFLDLFGTKTTGQLVFHSYSCEGTKGRHSTCYEYYIEFKNNLGKTYRMQANVPWIIGPLYDVKYMFTNWESPEGDPKFDVTVRYFFLFPYFSKITLPFHLEYLKVIDVPAIILIYIAVDILRADKRSLGKAQTASPDVVL